MSARSRRWRDWGDLDHRPPPMPSQEPTREWLIANTGEEPEFVDAVLALLRREETRWEGAKRRITKAGVMLAEHVSKMGAYLEAMNDARDAMLATPNRETWETYKIAVVRVSTIRCIVADRVDELCAPKH